MPRLVDEFEKVFAAWRELRAQYDKTSQDIRQRMGLPAKDEPVIDVGARPSRLRTAARAVSGAVALSFVVSAMVTFLAFGFQLLAALWIATRLLGMRIDMPRGVA